MRGLALLALLLAVPALADNDVLIVKYPVGSAQGYAAARTEQLYEEILQSRGATYTTVNGFAMSTANLRLGNLVLNNTTIHYDAVVCINFDNNGTSPTALTLVANWPKVPTALVASYSGNGEWTQAAGCSSGVQGHTAARDAAYNYYASYMVGTPYVWMDPGTGFQHLNPIAAAIPPGIFRVVVRDGITAASRRELGSTHFNSISDRPDSTGFNTGDSLGIWIRYGPAGNTVPLVFNSNGQNPGFAKMTLAILDSASGGAIFDDPTRRTQKHALWIGGAFTRCRWDSLSSSGARPFYSNGTFCAADSCDSVNVKAGLDSLNSLGIKYTVGVQADSINHYPSEKAWWTSSNARYGIEQSYATLATSGNASASFPIDPLGHVRARNMIGPSQTVLPYAISAGDTSAFALLVYLHAMIEAQWPGKFAHAIRPSYDDYSPSGDSRAVASRTRDSLNWMLVHAGITAVLTNPTATQGNVGRGSSIATAVMTSGTDPWGMDPVLRSERAPVTPGALGTNSANTLAGASSYLATAQSGYIGDVAYLPYRGEFVNAKSGWAGSHVIKSEWSRGMLRGDSWYSDWPTLAGSTFYQHDFLTSTPILYVPVGLLGGSGQGTPAVRQGYWPIKWVEMERRAVNALMIPGRMLDEWVWVNELRP